MGKAIIINTSKISIEQESKLEEFLTDNDMEFKEDSFDRQWALVTTQDLECDEW